jgi:hypothetical protein
MTIALYAFKKAESKLVENLISASNDLMGEFFMSHFALFDRIYLNEMVFEFHSVNISLGRLGRLYKLIGDIVVYLSQRFIYFLIRKFQLSEKPFAINRI